MQQFTLFPIEDRGEPVDTQEWGTFKDSLRAPIHNWFTYPAGFSYRAVEFSLRMHQIQRGQTIFDPFMGSGTTNLVAKQHAINSYGVEAHPFVYRVTRTKLNWDIDLDAIRDNLREVELLVRKQKQTLNGLDIDVRLRREFPELVLKCFAQNTLLDLLLIRDVIDEQEFPQDVKDFFFVGLTSILRQVSTAATGWPYIAPNKQKTTSLTKDALQEFIRQIHKMVKDILMTIGMADPNYKNSHHHIYNADSRDVRSLVPDASIDHVFTSPPYLNNFDYADRTRLELYFWGEAKSWNEISRNIRARLITSATTQITRDDPRYTLSDDLRLVRPDVYDFLKDSVRNLSQLRLGRGGKKSYDHLVSGYFNDMLKIIAEVFRVLKHNTQAVFVLGDSAPYGVHIPTDELIGKIGLGVGFSRYQIDVLRERGGKWKDNPQRHDQALRESIITLVKA